MGSPAKVSKKEENLTQEEIDYIESAVLEGFEFDVIAARLGVSEEIVKSVISSQKISRSFSIASKYISAKATHNIKNLANGYKQITKTYKAILDNDGIKARKEELISLLKEDKIDEFLGVIMEKTNGEYQIAIEEKQLPPDRTANLRLLEVFNPDLWDVEARRKKIPEVRINVTLHEDGKKSKMRKANFVDYEEIVE